MRLLVVEDNAELAQLLANGLSAAGFQVDLSATAEDARSALMTTRYSSIVLDLGLPDEDGMSILQEIRGKKDPVVQEEALRQADARIRELEGRSSEQPSGSFLGARGVGGGSVPSVGPRVTSSAQEPIPTRGPGFSAPAPGGFLASALSTAASVAGGMLLADSIRGLFGGHYGSAELGSPHADQAALDRAQDEAQDARDDADAARQDLAADDAALDEMQDAQDDAGGDWGGGDMDT